jgi:beta-galactosidase
MLSAAAVVLAILTPAPDYVWMESESVKTELPNVVGDWGQPDRLSQRAWIQVSIDAAQVESKVPESGAILTYQFETAKAGNHEVWNRLGFELVRSPFSWRIDQEPWKDCSPKELTTDLVPLADWTEVAWIKLGSAVLNKGHHKLEIRFLRTKDDKGQTARILYASDALLITDDPFHPNGKWKPGQAWSTPEDLKAAEPTALARATGPARAITPLGGTWQVARDDEQEPPFDIAVPMSGPPEQPHWSAIPVPSDRNVSRPDLIFAHRLWYRKVLDIPADQIGRAFILRFGQNCLNTSVLVNGQLCGFEKNPFVSFQVDLTKAIKPGLNEVLVGIRDAWYGYSTSPTNPRKLREKFNIPLSFTMGGFQDLAYPIWHGFQSGILDTPELVSTGGIYSSDVFVKPSVARMSLAVQLEVANSMPSAKGFQVVLEAVDPAGRIEKEIVEFKLDLGAHQKTSLDLEGTFENARLWWPDDPQMTTLRVTIRDNGKIVDVSETPFGFREWSSQGNLFILNGLPWRGFAELIQGPTRQEWLDNYRAKKQSFQRMSGVAQNGGVRWNGMTFNEGLDWCDRNGVVIRRSGILDGEAIGYMAVETDEDLKKLYKTEIKQQLLNNWRDQMVAQVKAERNHPSIHLWSLENEFLYINCINLYGGLMDEFEREVGKVGQAVAKADPTRLWMTDGGSAAKDNSFPVHGDHYVYTNDPSAYPALAYENFPEGGGRGRWFYDNKRPRYAGEDYFASGINPADYAWIAGEEAFLGKTAAHRGMALVQRMLTEGYRWNGNMGAAHFWLGDEGAQFNKYLSNEPRAVFVKETDWTFGPGPTKRTLCAVNDSRFDEPLTLKWAVIVAGKTASEGSQALSLKPGDRKVFEAPLSIPTVKERTGGTFNVTLLSGSKALFTEAKPISILPLVQPKLLAKAPVVFDPDGAAIQALSAAGVKFRRLDSLATLPEDADLLVIGTDAMSASESSSPVLAAWASGGRKVVVLEQRNPLKFQALPAEIEPTTRSGAFAYLEDANHPALRRLESDDFRGWGPDGKVFRNAYMKPVRGAKSLIQCHERLGSSALIEVPVGKGLLLLSQLTIGENLGRNIVARTLFCDLLEYASAYKQSFIPVTASVTGPLSTALAATGVQFTAEEVIQSIAKPGIAVIEASPANLQVLAANMPKVRAFTDGGGTIVLNGLTPDGLAEYNKLVGVDHLIRPFRREKTSFPLPRDHLTAGLSLGDVVMLSSERMFDFNSDMFVANDIFSYVVDLEDAAPFATLPNEYFGNTVNGFVSSDGWKYIFSFDLRTDKPEYTMTWPKQQEFTELEWTGNGFYHLVSKLELVFDASEHLVFDVKPNTEAQTLAIPNKRAKSITLRILDWARVPNAGANVVGIDNIRLKVKRPSSYLQTVHPMLNVGGLVRYSQGKGAIVLANLLFKDNESVPENALKKRKILATILQNLGAPFSGSKLIIAGGAGNDYTPLDLSKHANGFRNEKGWFGDPAFSFKDLPTGRQVLGGIPYSIYEFPTSPVPNCVIVGNGLADRATVSVERKASALFFLQAAKIDHPLQQWEIREKKQYEFAHYLIEYADGQKVSLPLIQNVDVDDFKQKSVRALPGAAVAWSKPYPGTEFTAVAYSKQWNNPRPEVTIKSVTLELGPDRRGSIALLAVSAVR